MIKVVLCDIDNNVGDLMFMKQETVLAAAHIFHKYYRRRSVESWVNLIWETYWKYGVEDQHIYEKVWQENYPKVNWDAVSEAVIKYRQIKSSQFSLYAGVEETLLNIRERGIKLVALTDAPVAQAYIRLHELRIKHFFHDVVVAQDLEHRKPDPRNAQLIMDKYGACGREVLIIGDMPERDVKLGKNLGLVTVFSKYGYWPGIGDRETDIDQLGLDADYRIDDIRELIKILEWEEAK